MYKVKVLMSTYNGEKYITEQLKSIFLQKEVEVILHIRDDGSTDNTVNLIKKVRIKHLIFKILIFLLQIFYQRNIKIKLIVK